MDENFAISEYVGESNLPKISCIIKRLFSDFIVIEIPLENPLKPLSYDVNLLSTTELKENTDILESSKLEPDIKRAKIENSVIDDEDVLLSKCLNEDSLKKIEEVFKGNLKSYSMDVSNMNKTSRKTIHNFLRKKYGKVVIANSQNGLMEFVLFDKKKVIDKRDIQDDYGKSCPKGYFLYFTMTKENKDTFQAINILSKFSGLKHNMFSIAGSKDKRAVTTQLVCVPQTSKLKFIQIRSKLRGIWLENFCYKKNKLQLGDLWGNHFKIVLRDLNLNQIKKDEVIERIKNWEKYGFLNYYGFQRFGSCGVNTAEVGRLILSMQWEKAINKILDLQNNLDRNLNNTENNSNKDNLKIKNNSIELQITNFLKKNPNDFKGAILNLPRDSRSLYIHAYQSLVFNKILTRRVKKYGLNVINGDLDINNKAITLDENKNLADIVLPLPSLNDNLPNNEIAEWYKQIAVDDGVSKDAFITLERNFIIGDVYRKILIKPKNVKWDFLYYNDDRCILQSSEFIPNKANNNRQKNYEDNNVTEKKNIALKIEFDLPVCSYATIALRELLRCNLEKSAQKALEIQKLAEKSEI